MGGIAVGTDDLAHEGACTRQLATPSPRWDRFSHWPRLRARLGLLALIVMLLAAIAVGTTARQPSIIADLTADHSEKRERDADLALYDRAIERIQQGENYYDFIVQEQRQRNYPVHPGLTVRLPTLAYINAYVGAPGQIAAAIALLAAVMLAWWERLREEPGGNHRLALTLALLYFGAALGLNRHFFVLHELWAGMLLALAFALHRPGRWGASLAIAGLALAIREHALPFVLLMGAMAFWRRDWKEGAAWSALALAFLFALAVHLRIVEAQVLPGDQPSYPWLVMRGLPGWLSNITLSSNLRFLPLWLAGPLIILAVTGWAGWRSPAGAFGTFLFLGYGLAFMLAGRASNFYWGAVIAPTLFMGLAFAPRAVRSLITSAFSDPSQALATAK